MAARPIQPPGSGLDRFFADPGAAAAKPAPADREKELRDAARRLGVDPYTSNPLLAVRLDQIAEVARAGRVGASTLLPATTPAAIAMPGSEVAHHQVYDTPAAELVAKNAERLRSFGAADEQIRAFQSAPGFTLTTQTALVESLGRLAEVQGRADVVALAATAATADQALYLVRAVGILADRDEQAPIDVLLARGTAGRAPEERPDRRAAPGRLRGVDRGHGALRPARRPRRARARRLDLGPHHVARAPALRSARAGRYTRA